MTVGLRPTGGGAFGLHGLGDSQPVVDCDLVYREGVFDNSPRALTPGDCCQSSRSSARDR